MQDPNFASDERRGTLGDSVCSQASMPGIETSQALLATNKTRLSYTTRHFFTWAFGNRVKSFENEVYPCFRHSKRS